MSRARLWCMFERRFERLRRRLWQWWHYSAYQPRRPVFLVGCQRSGTNMFHSVLAESRHTFIYNEDNSAAFRGFQLREPERIERLIRRSHASVTLFKPLCDSQWTDRILDRHTGSRAIWMYRHYPDVVNSMVVKWGAHQADTIRRIVEERWDELGWRGERLAREALELLRSVYRTDLTGHESGVLTWYLRNHHFFELDLDRDERVLLVRYDDLVDDPAALFPAIFDFMGTPFESHFASHVSTRSIKKAPFPEIDPEIRKIGDQMMSRLDAAYTARGTLVR